MKLDRNLILQTFAAESDEGFAAVEAILLVWQDNPELEEHVNTVFRVIHTVKGNALSLGFEDISAFAHKVEDLLDGLRAKRLSVSPRLTSTLLACIDSLRAAVSAGVAGMSEPRTNFDQLTQQLAEFNSVDPVPAQDANEARDSYPAAQVTPVAPKNKTLRVGVEKLDRLMNLTGEISIARGRARQLLNKIKSHKTDSVETLLQAHDDVDRLFLDLQEVVMRARMVPLGPVFRQCLRTVREVSAMLGKEAELIIEGADVEVDTSVTEAIRDPLMHMIRNALDHGIESPEERRRVGKHPRGRIELSAAYKGGNVAVQLRDDGRGISPENVRRRAVANGLIGAEERITSHDLYRVLFQPGFSTADEITDLSGRGVGLEVVRRNVEALRGSIQISSEVGLGTTVQILLPLTVAIMDGFLVGVGSETYVTPLDCAVECLDLPVEYVAGTNGSAIIEFRGTPVPVLSLRNVLNAQGPVGAREKVLIVRQQESYAGLLVDEFYGQQQVVIKSLGRLSRTAYGVSGSTILGDGRVALVLDVAKLISDAVSSTRTESVQGV